jgi:hypothetical protein
VLGRIPAAGERVTIGDAEVEVEKVTANALVSVVVRPAAAPEEPADG